MSTTLDPRAIEREIGRIRERESNPYSSGIKTNLFNLVIFAGHGDAGAQAAGPALQDLLGRRPARIITIDRAGTGRESTNGQAGAAVSGRCFPDARSRGVCFEEISIFGEGLTEDIGAWAPLLIRDIPVYAWVLGRPAQGSLAPVVEAAEFIDKLIVDTSAGGSPAEALDAIRALQAARLASRRSIVVSDFSWQRTRALRVAAARAFDPPEARGRLAEIREVSVAGLPPAEGAMFFLWLASRLGWKRVNGRPAGERSIGLPRFHDSRGVRITLSGAGARDEGARDEGARDEGARDKAAPAEAALRFLHGEPLLLSARRAADGEILLTEVDNLHQDALLEDALALAEEAV